MVKWISYCLETESKSNWKRCWNGIRCWMEPGVRIICRSTPPTPRKWKWKYNELSRCRGDFEVLSAVCSMAGRVESTERRYAAGRSRDQTGVEQLCRIWVISLSSQWWGFPAEMCKQGALEPQRAHNNILFNLDADSELGFYFVFF